MFLSWLRAVQWETPRLSAAASNDSSRKRRSASRASAAVRPQDSHQVGGQGSRPRVEIGEDDETLNERKALTDRVREPGGIGADRAAALSR